MNSDRIEEIQSETAHPDSVSVQQALLKVWNETEQDVSMCTKSLQLEDKRNAVMIEIGVGPCGYAVSVECKDKEKLKKLTDLADEIKKLL